jgi:hypothetical protein
LGFLCPTDTGLMKRVYYSSGSILTGDRTADVLVRYAEALAVRTASDTIDIPIQLNNGSVGRAQFLIGPASPLVVVPEDGLPAGPEDDDTIAELSRRTRSLSSPHPQAMEPFGNPYYADDGEITDSIGDDSA